MADRPSSRTRRILTERLESRRLLSAGWPGYSQPPFHWFELARGLGTPSAPFHHDFNYERSNASFASDTTPHSDVAAPAIVILAAPDDQAVGFVHIFVGWHSQDGADGFHWAGHDLGREASGDPVPPSPLLHQPYTHLAEDQAPTRTDSNSSETSSTASPGPALGQGLGNQGSTVVVVLSQPGSPQIQVITVKNEPKFVSADDRSASVPQPLPAVEPRAAFVAPSLLRAPASIPASASVAALPPIQTAAFFVAPRAAVEVTGVGRGGVTADPSAAQPDSTPANAVELVTAMTAASPANTAQIAMAASSPAAAVGAIRIASGWVRSAAAVVGRAFDGVPSVADAPGGYVTPVAYNFLRINPAMLFNDTVGRMIRESASLSPAAASTGHARAWAITGAVVAADAILVGSWHLNRRRKLRKAQQRAKWATSRRFDVAPVR